MKFILDNWVLIALGLISGGMLLRPVLMGAVTGGLTPQAAVQLINREKAVVVDVREPAEFAAGHLVGARNIPLAEIEAKLAAAVKNKNLPLILVCRSGARSASALATARKLGYAQAQSMAGGMAAWQSAKLPVDKA